LKDLRYKYYASSLSVVMAYDTHQACDEALHRLVSDDLNDSIKRNTGKKGPW